MGRVGGGARVHASGCHSQDYMLACSLLYKDALTQAGRNIEPYLSSMVLKWATF